MYAVCRSGPADPLPAWVYDQLVSHSSQRSPGLVSVTRTTSECSIVVPESLVPSDARAQRGFRALAIVGTLDFSLTGILSRLTTALAEAQIPVFALSTFDTDILLVRDTDAQQTENALAACGIRFVDES